jgi:tRNA(Ile)-lysidine synthase
VVKRDLSRRVRDFIQQHNLILPGQKVVVAVSGGADSVSLLHILISLQEGLGTKLHVAHLDHQLRGSESARDAEYVAGLAALLGVPVTVGRRDVTAYRQARGCSTEEAARELRYDFLAGVAGDVGALRVVTGHTRDDQVETILMHILRGSGISGLRGLEP